MTARVNPAVGHRGKPLKELSAQGAIFFLFFFFLRIVSMYEKIDVSCGNH